MLVSSYVNGSTAGSPPPPRDHSQDAKRREITGWSADAVRRHTKWLYSIDSGLLTGRGIAVTLTLRDCPDDADTFKRMRELLLLRLRRAGLQRGHWVTEWQRRRVPHMHCAFYFPDDVPWETIVCLVLSTWLQIAGEHGATVFGQYAKVIDGPVGWLQYLSKHASRGVKHYQRWGSPDGWAKTGRLWGKVGEWPAIAPMRFDMPAPAFHRYRRLMRSWRLADARTALAEARRRGDPELVRKACARIRFARRMLQTQDRKLSAVRGVSEWAGESHTLALMGLLHSEGFPIIQRDE